MMTLDCPIEASGLAFSPDSQVLAATHGKRIKLFPLDLSIMDRDPFELLDDAQREAGMRLDGFNLQLVE